MAASKKFKPDDVTVETKGKKSVITVEGNKYVDTEGGFLLAEETLKKSEEVLNAIEEDDFKKCFERLKRRWEKCINVSGEYFEGDIVKPSLFEDNFEFDVDPNTCTECKGEYFTSYLLKTFDYSVCDKCRDSEEKHSLITRTDAKADYLLKDCDLDKREPILKFILRQNPHNPRWGQMKLYLLPQIEKRAMEVWGSLEELEKAHIEREEKRSKSKAKKFSKDLKTLKMAVRSSLFNRTSAPTHQHEFGPEEHDSDTDMYFRVCITCKFKEEYEKI